VRAAPAYVMPTASKLPDGEIAQARNLTVECLAVRQGRKNPEGAAWRSGRLALGFARLVLATCDASDLVNPDAVHLLRSEPQLEARAHHAGKESTHRMLLSQTRKPMPLLDFGLPPNDSVLFDVAFC
jgi:hypothetical protein